MSNWEEHRLNEQVQTLRHLPPGTWLPQPHYQPDRDLLASLLHLQDEIDPLQWLKESHADLIARVLLWTALDRIRSHVQGVSLAVRAGQEIPIDDYQQWLGNLLDLPEDVEPFQRLIGTHPTTTSPELLHTVFLMLRALRKGGQHSVEGTGDKILLLLDDLFQLPGATDPLQWIQDEHSDLAAIETLRHVLTQIQLPDPLFDGQVIKVQRLDMRSHTEGPSVVLHEMVLKPAAFVLTLRARLPEGSLRALAARFPGIRGINWEGVERVVDDLGYHYLVCHRLQEGVTHWPWRSDLSLRLLCYPLIASTATAITVSSKATSFVILGLEPGEQRRRSRMLHRVHLGNLTWYVKVPK